MYNHSISNKLNNVNTPVETQLELFPELTAQFFKNGKSPTYIIYSVLNALDINGSGTIRFDTALDWILTHTKYSQSTAYRFLEKKKLQDIDTPPN